MTDEWSWLQLACFIALLIIAVPGLLWVGEVTAQARKDREAKGEQ